MRSQSIQVWTGCTDTISVARIIPLEDHRPAPVLSEEAPLRVGLPATERAPQWKPCAAEELSLGRMEESDVPAAPHALAQTDHRVPVAPSQAETHQNEGFRRQPVRPLWTTLARPQDSRLETLRVSPEGPTEIKYRIWIQPMEESTRYQLRRASGRPCPASEMPGLEALSLALEHPSSAEWVSGPGVPSFAVRGLTERPGTLLQAALAPSRPEVEQLLYPGGRRLPIAETLTVG